MTVQPLLIWASEKQARILGITYFLDDSLTK